MKAQTTMMQTDHFLIDSINTRQSISGFKVGVNHHRKRCIGMLV